MHMLQVMTFLPCRNLTKACPFATRCYLLLNLRTGLVASYFLLFAFFKFLLAPVGVNFLLFSGCLGIAPLHILILRETTFINDPTGDLM